MKTALLLYWHGLGDLICLTPQLRELHCCGYAVDIICRKSVIKSRLFADCPYVRQTIPVPYETGGPAEGGIRGTLKSEQCFELFHRITSEYDIAIEFSEQPQHVRGGKIVRNNKVCDFINLSNLDLEVFISNEAEKIAKQYIDTYYPNGYIFCHTMIEWHRYHNWDASEWMKKNLDDLPIVNVGAGQTHEMLFGDINISFVLAREARYRVLSSSVFVHACDAMNAIMDVVHYGRGNKHGWPLDSRKIKVIHGVK